jgi:membrane protein implicated in regulation of membrane protease activity
MLTALEKAAGVVRGAVYLGALIVTPWFAVSALHRGAVALAALYSLIFALVAILAMKRVRQCSKDREGNHEG